MSSWLEFIAAAVSTDFKETKMPIQAGSPQLPLSSTAIEQAFQPEMRRGNELWVLNQEDVGIVTDLK